MVEIISNLVGNEFWATLVMSVFPLIELKGGIVFARGVGLDFLLAFALAYLGATVVFFPIYFLLRPILNLLKKIKFISKIAQKAEALVNPQPIRSFAAHFPCSDKDERHWSASFRARVFCRYEKRRNSRCRGSKVRSVPWRRSIPKRRFPDGMRPIDGARA